MSDSNSHTSRAQAAIAAQPPAATEDLAAGRDLSCAGTGSVEREQS